jgi:GWxTD domain-containing protein
VVWIITAEELAAFNQLSGDKEREHFVDAFWWRRDPTPDTEENEYKEEHYRRLAYANEHFAAATPGWKTDRGRTYIVYGPPDEIESHPSDGKYNDAGQTGDAFPFELWRYRYLEGLGKDVVLKFVDSCRCGDYRLTVDPQEKNPWAPNAGTEGQSKEAEQLEPVVKAIRPPAVKFKDLEELASHNVHVAAVPFAVLADFVRVTDATVLVPITLQVKNRDITFIEGAGLDRGTINIFGRLIRIGGRIELTFEDTMQVDVAHEWLPKSATNASVYAKTVPLSLGRYLLEVVVQDVSGNRAGSLYHRVEVPAFDRDQLSTSSLIVADTMGQTPTRKLGTGSFVIGATYLRPRVRLGESELARFKRTETIDFWLQVYHLAVNQKTHKPSALVVYDITGTDRSRPVIHRQQSTDEMGDIGDQITLEKTLAAANLGPGAYRVRIRITDGLAKQMVERSASFVVE